MNKKKILALFSVISTSVLALTVVFAAKPDLGSTFALMNRSNGGYSCNDIVFSESVNNPGSYSDITDLAAEGVTNLDCSMTEWTNANYLKNSTSSMSDSAIKIGGSKSGKYAGSVKLTLNQDMTTDKLIIYSTGWKSESGTQKIGVNGSYQDVAKTTDTYVFSPYTFELDAPTNEIIISNDAAATGSRRIVISKIVLRLYNEAISGGGGGDTPIDPPAPTEATQVDFTLDSASSITNDGITVSFAKASGGTAPTWYSAGLRLYAKNTITITSSSSIVSMSFNWEKQGTKAFASASADIGSYTHPSAAGIGTWTGSANTIVITVGDSGQLQLNTFSIFYQ